MPSRYNLHFNCWHSSTLVLSPERQSARMSQINKCLANANRPCDRRCAVPTSEKFTVQLCALYFRHDVIRLSWPRSWQCVPYCPVLWMSTWRNSWKQRVWKPMVDFIFVVIGLFSLSPTVEMLWAEIGRSRHFSKGWVTLSADFRGKGASPTNHCWCQKTRVIAVSCGIKISQSII